MSICEGSEDWPVIVTINDHTELHETCQDVCPRPVEIRVDGELAGVIEIPCRDLLIIPADRYGLEHDAHAGHHELKVLDLQTGGEATVEFEHPHCFDLGDGAQIVNTGVSVSVFDDHTDIHEPGFHMKGVV